MGPGWAPKFVDYVHFAFATTTAFSPTDVSAIKPWTKLMMMAEEAISLIVALLVVARAVKHPQVIESSERAGLQSPRWLDRSFGRRLGYHSGD